MDQGVRLGGRYEVGHLLGRGGMAEVSQRLTEEWLIRAGADGQELLQQFRAA